MQWGYYEASPHRISFYGKDCMAKRITISRRKGNFVQTRTLIYLFRSDRSRKLDLYHECDTLAYMVKTSYVNARVEPELKKNAEKVLKRVGVKTSDAVGMFLQQIVLHEGIPFEVRIPNKKTKKAIADLRAGKGKIYTGTTKEIFDALEKER